MKGDIIQAQRCHPDDLSEEIRISLASSPERICIKDERIYVQLDQSIFSFPNDQAGSEIAYAAARRQTGPLSRPENARELYERIVRDQHYLPDPVLLKKLGILKEQLRCAAVFRSYYPLESDLYSFVSSMAPAEKGDAVIPIDYQSAVFVKNLEKQSADEMTEFIEAVIGTMEDEGITGIRAGIGRGCTEITEIRLSCQEAIQALDLGMRYRKPEHVFVYEKQTLERIVDAIPEKERKNIRQQYFNRGSAGGLSDEMLETVRVFFRNDLNLTAASKQLFIHRNTLNYRLDKIKKDFGLDLRSFQDAAVFRIICEIADET